jgi:phytoene desaturase
MVMTHDIPATPAPDEIANPGAGRPRALVIGTGFGGLAAAVRLLAKGYGVTMLEALEGPGGRAFTWVQDGHVFDAGPTIITVPQVFEELWALAGRRLSDDVVLKPLNPFYRIRFDDGDTFEATHDLDMMRAQIRRLEPADVDGFERYLKVSEEIFEAAYTKLVDVPFHELSTLVSSAPDMIRLGGYRSVHAKVSQFFKHPKLRIAFSFHPLFIGGNPMTATSYYCLIAHLERTYGVHYAVGGTGALVRGLVSLVERMGGAIRYGANVAEITTRDGRATGVRLENGEQLDADLVVSNAEIGTTYGRLLKHAPRRTWSDAKLARAAHSMSLFVWYFGTDRRYEDVPHHTIALGPRFGGLLDDIFRRKVLAEDFSLYLHRPTASDPTLAPMGRDTFYVLSPVPHLDSGVDWTTMAEPYRRRIEARLAQTLLPGLEGAITSSRVLTPLDFRDRLQSTKGSAFGLEPQLLQSAWFRPHNVSSDIKGLYLVGAGTHPGAGVPGVLNSAKVLDRLVPHASAFIRA